VPKISNIRQFLTNIAKAALHVNFLIWFTAKMFFQNHIFDDLIVSRHTMQFLYFGNNKLRGIPVITATKIDLGLN